MSVLLVSPLRLQFAQDAADLFVEMGDHAVVFGQLVADDLGCAGPGRQRLVAARHPAVMKRMLRHEVLGVAAGGGHSSAGGMVRAAGGDRAAM